MCQPFWTPLGQDWNKGLNFRGWSPIELGPPEAVLSPGLSFLAAASHFTCLRLLTGSRKWRSLAGGAGPFSYSPRDSPWVSVSMFAAVGGLAFLLLPWRLAYWWRGGEGVARAGWAAGRGCWYLSPVEPQRETVGS